MADTNATTNNNYVEPMTKEYGKMAKKKITMAE